jgi:hypothetical protein
MTMFGVRSARLGTVPLGSRVPCDLCGRPKLTVAVVGTYFHVLFVPTYPLARRASVGCAHCHRVIPSEAAAPGVKAAAEAVVTRLRVPRTHYLGLAAAVASLLFCAVLGVALLGEPAPAQNAWAPLAAPVAVAGPALP